MATLADGQLPNAKATLYTATGAVVVKVALCNTAGSSKGGNLYIKRSGSSSRKVRADALDASQAAIWPALGAFPLSTGDIIEGDDGGGGGASVDFVIGGQ